MNETLSAKLDPDTLPAGFKVTPCSDQQVWDRIVRAAKFCGQPVETFVWHGVADLVTGCEDDYILSSKTGEPIGDRMDL
jgi:hypothetical protein